MKLLIFAILATTTAAFAAKKKLLPCITQGCSNEVCVQKGETVITNCVYSPVYDCLKFSKCKRLPTGKCGWVDSDKTKKCQEAAKANVKETEPNPQ